MISFLSLFEIISAVVRDPKMLFSIAASVADATAVSANVTKMFLSNGVSTLFITGKPTDINGLRKLRIPPF